MGIPVLAKGLADIVRAHDRREWLTQSPGTAELAGSSALIIGYGAIGGAIGTRLKAMNVQVTGVRRLADHADSIFGADEWRADRTSVVVGTSVSFSVDFGAGLKFQQQSNYKTHS